MRISSMMPLKGTFDILQKAINCYAWTRKCVYFYFRVWDDINCYFHEEGFGALSLTLAFLLWLSLGLPRNDKQKTLGCPAVIYLAACPGIREPHSPSSVLVMSGLTQSIQIRTVRCFTANYLRTICALSSRRKPGRSNLVAS